LNENAAAAFFFAAYVIVSAGLLAAGRQHTRHGNLHGATAQRALLVCPRSPMTASRQIGWPRALAGYGRLKTASELPCYHYRFASWRLPWVQRT